MAAVMAPRLEVVGDRHDVETVPLGGDAVVEQLLRGKLLGRGLVSVPERRLLSSCRHGLRDAGTGTVPPVH